MIRLLAVNPGQRLGPTSSPTFANLTITGTATSTSPISLRGVGGGSTEISLLEVGGVGTGVAPAVLRHTVGHVVGDNTNDVTQWGMGMTYGGAQAVAGVQAIYTQQERAYDNGGGHPFSEWWIGTIDTAGVARRHLMLTVDHVAADMGWSTVSTSGYTTGFDIAGKAATLRVNDSQGSNAVVMWIGVGVKSWQLRYGASVGFGDGLTFYNTTDNFSPFAVKDAGGFLSNGPGTFYGYIEGAEQTAPAAPAANGYRIYAEDNGAGKTRLMCLFASGAAQQLAIEP